MWHWSGIVHSTNCSFAEIVYLEPAEKLAHKTVIERFVAVVRSKNSSPTWSDVRTALLDFRSRGPSGTSARPLHCEQRQPSILARAPGLGS
jgi:lysozyme family protein